MISKIKIFIKQTWIYTVYLFFVRNYRKFKAKVVRSFNKIRKKIEKAYDPIYQHIMLKVIYPNIYKKYSKLPVDERKVIFVEHRYANLTNSFKTMYDYLYINFDVDIHCHFMRNLFALKKEYRDRCKAMVKDMATAKYVFFDEATNIIGGFEIRSETVVTQLWHGCGAFKKFGFSTADKIFGSSMETLLKYPIYRNYTNVTVSSPEVVWAYEEAMNYPHESGVVKPLGSSRTDVFFDQEFIDEAYKTLYEMIPAAKSKKVILYAPTFRGGVRTAASPDRLNVELMQYELADEYIILIKHHPLVKKPPKIPDYCDEFAFDVTNKITIEDLLCVSDICVSDYSSLIFEYSLFERPMFFLAHDLDTFFDWRGFYYSYEELAPGPIVTNTGELIDVIRQLKNGFDKEKVTAFKEKFMSSCDGHATERIVDTIMTPKEKAALLRKTPLEKRKYHLEPSCNI